LKKIKNADAAISVYLDSIVHPNLWGIGGAFNEQGGEAFMSLPAADRKLLAEALFSPTKGAGFSFCRTAIGSSDFGLSAYSYSETPDDFEMKHFSVERDTKTVIPFILAAKEENPGLKMFASPWSPPGWMKVSGKMDGGKGNEAINILKSDPLIYKAYALYFSKYLQEYERLGVKINRLLVQNETDMNPKYPGCDMSPELMEELISGYILPQFKKDDIKTELWAGTFRGKRSDAQTFMKLDGSVNAAGVGLQYCKPPVMSELRTNYPNLKMMHTEGACFNGNNSMKQARSRFAEIADWINAGCDNYCYWNMVLNETGSSAWDWKQNSLVNIDRQTASVTYNPDYAPVTLLSRYIRPGDQCLKIETAEGETAIAVRNSNRLVVFVQNNQDTQKTQSLELDGKIYAAELPAQSLCALIFEK
jgi:glucosylceramidase